MGQSAPKPEDSESNNSPNKAWRESLPPPLTAEQQATAIKVAKEYEAESKKLSEKINVARNEYGDMYYEDPKTWQIITFDERIRVLKERLAKKGITFSEPEEIALRTTLKSATIKMID